MFGRKNVIKKNGKNSYKKKEKKKGKSMVGRVGKREKNDPKISLAAQPLWSSSVKLA